MTALLDRLKAGKFVARMDFQAFGYSDAKGMDNAIYKLRVKGHDIQKLDEDGGAVYYLRRSTT